MQIVMSCAKDMSSHKRLASWPITEPLFKREAIEAAAELVKVDTDITSQWFGCSESIAELNQIRFSRFPAWSSDDDLPDLLQAGVAYSGVAFRQLRVADMNLDEMLASNDHLWLVSFLYGLLRPLDGILPYRLEGKVKLDVHSGKSMFDWWRPRLTDVLLESVKADDGILLWCSTGEMKRMVDWKRLTSEVCVIEPEFYVVKDGNARVNSVFAKQCRGQLAREAIVRCADGSYTGLSDLEELLTGFDFLDFKRIATIAPTGVNQDMMKGHWSVRYEKFV